MPFTILLIEDNPGDVRLTLEAFGEVNPEIRFCVVADGVEGLGFLQQDVHHAGAPRPDLIILDLNLPRMDGRELLARIKRLPVLQSIPAIILTTSDAEADIAQSYQLSANAFLNKPLQLKAFQSLVSSINDFWVMKAKLPQNRVHH